ncbi:MAG TPA: tetratricopeptide repeat protein [Planctomycetota bacterium]|nr:tetratricopeptide repeat protein [Planctomycetota bacterium]
MNPDVSGAGRHFAEGDRLFGEGRYDEATVAYETGLRLDPDDAGAQLGLARVYHAVGLITRALAMLAELLEKHPALEAALLLQATILLEQDRPAETLIVTQKLFKENPDNVEGLVLAGKALGDLGRIDPAKRRLTRALEIDAACLEACLELADLSARDEDFEAALDWLTKGFALKPDDYHVRLGLGWANGELGRVEEAVRNLEEAARLAPDKVEPALELAHLRERSGDLPSAIALYRDVLRREPTLTNARQSLAECLADLDRLDEAADEYRALVSQRPDEADYHAGLGQMLSMQGKSADAEREYRCATELAPKSPDLLCELAGLYQRSGRHGDAEQAYLRAIAVAGDHAPAHNGLGMLYHEMGKLAEAARDYSSAVKLEPASDWPHFNLGLVFEESGELAKAETCFRRVVDLVPGDAEARCCLGNALREQSRYDEALAQFQKAAELAPDDPSPCAELCFFYHECLVDAGRAAQFGRRFLALGGKDPEIDAVLESIGNGFTRNGPEPSDA